MRLTKTKNNYKKLSSRKNKVKRSKKVRGGGITSSKQQYKRLSINEPKKIKIVAFDVDETLSGKGQRCGGSDHGVGIDTQRDRLITLLNELKSAGVKLYIITRCQLNGNILNDTNLSEHYQKILQLMDGAFGADKSGNSDTHILINPKYFNPNPNKKKNDGGLYWAHIKPFVLDKIRENLGEKLREDITTDQVMLVDDDTINAKIASQRGYHAITTQGGKKSGGIDMTISGLDDLIKNRLTGNLLGNDKYKYEPPKYDKSLPEILTGVHKKRITEKVKTEVITRDTLPPILPSRQPSQPSHEMLKSPENNEPLPELPSTTSTRLAPIPSNVEPITDLVKRALIRHNSNKQRLLNTQPEGGRDNFTQEQLNKFKQKAKKNSQKIKQKNKNKYPHISDALIEGVELNNISNNNNLKHRIKKYSKKNKWYRFGFRSKNKRLKELNQILSRTIPIAKTIPPNIITDIEDLIRYRSNIYGAYLDEIESSNYYYTVDGNGSFDNLIEKNGDKYYILERRQGKNYLINNDEELKSYIPRLIKIPKDKIKKINQQALSS